MADVQKPHASSDAPECMAISEKQFMRDHTLYSAVSSWLFAISNATNIGLLCAFSSKALTAAEKGLPFFKSNDPAVTPVFGNKKYNRIALGVTVLGGACMAASNWLESKKCVTEWQLGAGKLQRKMAIAEEHVQMMSADATATVAHPAQAVTVHAQAQAADDEEMILRLPGTRLTPDRVTRLHPAIGNPVGGVAASIALFLALALPFAANAETDSIPQHDKRFAQTHITPDLRAKCLDDAAQRMAHPLRWQPSGKLAFNEKLTRVVYKTLYWNNADRGVAFTLPVKARDPELGTVSAQVACFYALNENGLEFQLAQPLPWRVL